MRFSSVHLTCMARYGDKGLQRGYSLNPLVLISADDPVVVEAVRLFKEEMKEKMGSFPYKIGLVFSVDLEED